MSETRFTPGPLHVVREADEPRRYWIVRNPQTWEGRVCMVPDYDRHDARVMAHLFAAAPALYEALGHLLVCFKAHYAEGKAIDMAEAALRLARGETE